MNQEDIGRLINEVLGYPHGQNSRRSKGVKLVKVIKTVIIDALKRGESVNIHGFGTFVWHTQKPRKHGAYYFYGKKGGTYHNVIQKPARTYVRFKPSLALKRYLKEHPHGN